jgi:hypothetical protein
MQTHIHPTPLPVIFPVGIVFEPDHYVAHRTAAIARAVALAIHLRSENARSGYDLENEEPSADKHPVWHLIQNAPQRLKAGRLCFHYESSVNLR